MKMFSVQKILDKRTDPITNNVLYLIKWEGYDIAYSTWEPLQNVKNCRSLLAQFETKYENVITTFIGKIYVPEDINKNGTPKLSRSIKIRKLSKKTPSKILEKSESGQSLKQKNCIQLKSQVLNKKLDENLRSISRRESKQIKKNQFFPQEKQFFSISNSLTRKNSLNLNQDSYAKQEKTSLRARDILQYNKTNQYQSEDRADDKQRRINKEVRSFTPIIIQNAASKICHKNSVKKENWEKKESEKQEYKKKKSKENNEQKQLIDIIGMRKLQQGCQFYVSKLGEKYWVSYTQIFENYTKDLCRFYEKYLKLQ